MRDIDRTGPWLSRRSATLAGLLLAAVATGAALAWGREPTAHPVGSFRMTMAGDTELRASGPLELGKGSLIGSAGQEATLILSRSDGPLGPGVHAVGPRGGIAAVEGLVIVGTPSYPRAVYRATAGVVSIAAEGDGLRGSFRIEGTDAGRRMVASGSFTVER